MNKNKRIIRSTNIVVAIFFSFLISNTAFAQIEISGEIRPRTEVRYGYGTLSSPSMDPAFFTDQRTRLNLKYGSEKYKVGFVLQDIRTWGATSQLNRSDAFSAIHEAWGEYMFNKNVSIKAGRQEVVYDNHRIFGNVGWAQQARSHDLLKLRLQNDNSKLDLGFAFNQDGPSAFGTDYTTGGNYKTMQYLWAHRDVNDNLGISILLLNNGMQLSTTDTAGVVTYDDISFSQTIGGFASYKKNSLKINGQFYAQTGKDGADRDLSAYNAMAEIFYTIKEKLTVGLGFELLSGTTQLDSLNTENNSFTPFYGTNHKFNGFMDYFYVGNHVNDVGLQDIYFRVMFKEKKFTGIADFHMFSTAEDLLDTRKQGLTGEYTATDALLGNEIDLTLKYAVSKEVTLQGGYSILLADDAMEILKGGDKDEINNWGYIMLTFKPVFYSSK